MSIVSLSFMSDLSPDEVAGVFVVRSKRPIGSLGHNPIAKRHVAHHTLEDVTPRMTKTAPVQPLRPRAKAYPRSSRTGSIDESYFGCGNVGRDDADGSAGGASSFGLCPPFYRLRAARIHLPKSEKVLLSRHLSFSLRLRIVGPHFLPANLESESSRSDDDSKSISVRVNPAKFEETPGCDPRGITMGET